MYEKQYFVDNWVSRANENQNYAEYGFQFDTTDSGYSNTVEYDNVIDSVKKTHTAKKQPGIKFTEAQTSKRHDSRRTYNTHKATSTSRKTAANSETAAPSSLESFADISHVTSKTIQHSRSTPDSIQLVTGNTFETIDKVTTHKDYSLPTFSNEYLASKAAHFTKFPFITQSLSITKQRDIIVSPSTVRSHAPTLVSEAENGAIHQYKAEFSQMTPDSSKNTVADNSIDRSIANKQNTELVHSADATNEDPRTVFIDSGSEMIDQETLLGQTNTDTTNTMLFVDTYDSASPLVTIVNEQQQPGARNFNLIYNVVQPEDNIPVQSTQSLSANEHVPDSDNNTFDPAKLIWLPNGNWTPSCKHVSKGQFFSTRKEINFPLTNFKGRYCLNADGEGKVRNARMA